MAAIALTDRQLKRTVRDLIAGREVDRTAAHEAIRWLGADATVVDTANGGVRLRVPILPRAASDIRSHAR